MATTVRIEKLNDANYSVWKRQMYALLVERDVSQAVEPQQSELVAATAATGQGSNVPVADSAATVETANTATLLAQKKAHALITLNVSVHLLHLVDPKKDARQVWLDLERHFNGANLARQLQLKRQFTDLRLGKSEKLSTYFSRAQELRESLLGANVPVTIPEFHLQLLSGLPDGYSAVVDTMVTLDVSTADLLQRLRVVEARLSKGKATAESSTALQSHAAPIRPTANNGNGRSSSMKCPKCGKLGHPAWKCRSSVELRSCHNCGKKGHLSSKCPQRNPSASASQATGDDAHALMSRAGIHVHSHEDYMLEHNLFSELQKEVGTEFTLDACANEDGSNAFVDNFCSRGDSFLGRDLRGERVWMNPPFRRAGAFLQHYLDEKSRDPHNTSCVAILPRDPTAKWWPLVKGWKVLRSWEAGTQLFTLPTTFSGRRRWHPCHFPVVAVYDPPKQMGATGLVADGCGKQNTTFIVDSGASHHMSPYRCMFVVYSSDLTGLPSAVTVANGTRTPVAGHGTIALESMVKGHARTVELKHVLHVPGMSHNLVSISKAMDSGCDVTFRNSRCLIAKGGVQLLNAHKAIKGEHKGLFILDGVSIKSASRAGNVHDAPRAMFAHVPPSIPAAKVTLWHRRLGHPGLTTMAQVPDHARGIDVSKQDINGVLKMVPTPVCESCQLSRQTRAPRTPSSTPRATRALERVHVDLCGPFQVRSRGGSRYYLLAVDECTRYSVLKPVPTKEAGGLELMPLLRHMESLLNSKVQRLRSDRGG